VTKTLPVIALLALAAVVAIAGCGSSSNSSSSEGGAYGGSSSTSSASGTEKTAASGAESGAAVLTVAKAAKVGPVLVDAKGFTVYDFHKDKGTTSSCYGACAQVWPPVLSEGAPTAGEGAMSSKLGTTSRKDGTTQVTYAGHPLYTYTVDQKPGEANGNDSSSFGAQWYALKANGEEAGG
jgi:predicted lipoprotein with Yx(FWY)xxD motif